MAQLNIKQEQLAHTAIFDSPVLSLWNEGRRIFSGLYQAFRVFGVSLNDMRVEGQNPADQAVAVSLRTSALHRFRFDRVETTFFNFADFDQATVPKVLSASLAWIRGDVPGVRVATHQLVYTTHSTIDGADLDALLRRIGGVGPTVGGEASGNGVIFHWNVADMGWTTQLIVDQSLAIPGGIFLSCSLHTPKDDVNFDDLIPRARSYLASILGELGMQLPP